MICDLECRLDALRLQGILEPVCVVAAEQPLRLRQIVQQRCRASVNR